MDLAGQHRTGDRRVRHKLTNKSTFYSRQSTTNMSGIEWYRVPAFNPVLGHGSTHKHTLSGEYTKHRNRLLSCRQVRRQPHTHTQNSVSPISLAACLCTVRGNPHRTESSGTSCSESPRRKNSRLRFLFKAIQGFRCGVCMFYGTLVPPYSPKTCILS